MTTSATHDFAIRDSRPRLVCFDLGGVVVRICRSWPEACRQAGIEVRDSARFDDAERKQRRKELHAQYETGQLVCDVYWRAISESIGGVYSPAEVERVHSSWIIEHYAGITDVIERLAVMPGVETACLSNTNARHWQLMNEGHHSAAVPKLRHRVASHLINVAKPDPMAYRIVEECTGRAPGEIVFFDDMPENIEAALARGWKAHRIDHTGDTAAQVREHLAQYDLRV